MGPKAKGRGKKGKRAKEKRPRTPKSEYVARVAERNAVLAAARLKVQEAENIYYSTEKRYEQTQEDMSDIIKYLQREIEDNNLEIASYDETIAMHKEEISNNDKHYLGILSKMKALYEERERALNYKIRQHIPKLAAYEEIRQQREEFLKKKELLWKKLQEEQVRQDKEIYEAEKQVIIKQDTMQKEMEYKLTNLATDFNQATDIAIGETTNKLIKENIILGNKLTCTQEIFDRSRDSYQKAHEVEKKMRYLSELLDEEHHIVLQKHTSQVNYIESLLKSHEEFSERISLTGKLIKENRRLQRDISEKERTLCEEEDEYEELLQKLNESEEKFGSIRSATTLLRKNLITLERSVYEAAKKVKEGLDIEAMTEVPDDFEEELAEEEKEDLDDYLKEFKYKVRVGLTEEVVSILSNAVINDMDMHTERPSEYRFEADSIASSIATMRSPRPSRKN